LLDRENFVGDVQYYLQRRFQWLPAHVMRAAEIVQNPAQLSARDAIHIAVMERHGVRSIFTFDADFDRWPGLKRLHGTVS